MGEVLPAAGTPLGEWVRERLRGDAIGWLTSVDARGVPQPNPVWFLWEDDSILVYNRATAVRLVNIQRRPLVTLHLDTYGRGGDAVVLIGIAEVRDEPPADQNPAFLHKYRELMTLGPERWAQMFPVALRISVTRFRGFHQAGPDRRGV